MPAPVSFVWTDRYAVGVASIDAQHRPIVNLLQTLHCSPTHVDMGAASSQLLDYARSHFTHEEALMREYRYPDWVAHRGQHEKFVHMLNAFIINAPGSNAVAMARMVVIRWFIDHITSDVMDRRLGAFLQERGVP